jgi:hypothetical protein
MTSNQPVWKLLDVLGDVNPIDHGGMLVYQDETGVYAPEAVVICALIKDYEDDPDRWIVYRFPLDRCTYVDGILSDNEFHPEHPAWFANALGAVAVRSGLRDLTTLLCSADPIERAQAYQAIGDCHGFINLDHEPVTDLDRSEMEARYGS